MTGAGLVGRRQARLILIAAVGLDALIALLFLAAPNTIGPLGAPSPLVSTVSAFGIALNVAGLVWMVRIYRTNPEGDRSPWRSSRGPDR